MNIKTIAATLGTAALIAVSGAFPVEAAQNTSETGHTHITRSSRSQADTVTLQDGDSYGYINYSSFDMLFVSYMDMDGNNMARMAVDLMDSDYMLGELDGFEYDGTFRVKDAGYCSGIAGYLDGLPIHIVACADGPYVVLIMATDKDAAVDVAQQIYEVGAFAVPAGYVEEDL